MSSAAKQVHVSNARPVRWQLPGGTAISALVAGRPGAPAVLLVPGYTGSKEDFAPVLEPLAQAGLRAVAIDQPGQFESPGPDEAGPGDAGAYAPDRLAATLGALADDLGPRVRLLGHSFGGLVARAAVIARPERFDSLVLLSSGPAAIGGNRRATIEALEPVLAAHGLAGVYAAMRAAETAAPGYVASAAELAAFLERRFLAGSPAMLQGMGVALRTEPDRVAELRASGVPTLVVCGVDDDAWPVETQREMAARLGAPFALVPGAAHSAAVENPDALVKILLDFWAA